MKTQVTLTLEQACSVFALQRVSKQATEEAIALRQFGQKDAAASLDATAKRLDAETERLMAEYESGIIRPPGLVRPA